MEYNIELLMMIGSSVVRRANFSTRGEAEGYARRNGYHKPNKANKKKIESDPWFEHYQIVEH